MLHVALLEPEIPPNTGNIARLCAATGTALHLIGRLGFRLDERSLRRAGLDYWPAVDCRGHASLTYTRIKYQDGDCLMFGGESRGLPKTLLEKHPDRTVTIPMPADRVRSLNLATAVGIALYEA